VTLASLAAIVIGLSAADSAPIRPLTQWVHTTWTVSNGAPGDVRELAQTPDGYLWLGTNWGLYRFDGVQFVSLRDLPGVDSAIVGGGVQRLHASSDGSLWIVWGGGSRVTRLQHGRLEQFDAETALPLTFDITESRNGTLIAGTVDGLFEFTDGTWTNVNQKWGYPGTDARTVRFDGEDGLWALAELHVFYRPPGGPRFLESERLRTEPPTTDFAEAIDGSMWLAEMSRSVHTVSRPGRPEPLTEVKVGSVNILIDRSGSLWIGTQGDGLRRVIDPALIRGRSIEQFGQEAEHYTEKDGLLSDVVTALLEDKEGNIWIGSSRGLERFRQSLFVPSATPGGVRPRIIYAAHDTSLWVAAFSRHGFFRIGPRDRELVDTLQMPLSFAQDRSGRIWSVYRSQLMRLEGRRFVSNPTRPPVRNLSDVAVDSNGRLWVYDEQQGLLRLERDSLIQVVPPGFPSVPTGRLFGDRVGRIWVAEYNGVALYDRGRVTRFDRAHGGFSDWVKAFHEDRDGVIWALGYRGIHRFQDGRLRTLPARQALPGVGVFGVVEDDDGAWWVATRDKVLRLPPGEVQRAWADSTYRMQYRSFDSHDGLPGILTQAMVGPVVARTGDGLIWVATDHGVASVNPRELASPVSPPVLVEVLRVDGVVSGASNGLIIPPKPGTVEIDYTAMTLSTPERVRFRYRLEGEDADWQNVGTRRRAYYTSLAPGTYRFRVAASHGDDLWGSAEATLSFRVLPAWYQAIWFRGLVIFLIGGLGAGLAVLIQRRRHLRAQAALTTRYEATLTERARIAQDLHDTLLQGFAGVTLQLKTAELALPERPDVAAETLLRVQQLARESLREARQRVWDMRDAGQGGDDLPSALEACARDRTAGSGIEVSVVTAGQPRRLARALEDAAFQIGREAVVNAVQHAQARRIEIRVEFGVHNLRIEVRDDGRGFTADQGEAARRDGHFGLSGMRSRADRVGGRCEVHSRPGGGTVVALELPVGKPARP